MNALKAMLSSCPERSPGFAGFSTKRSDRAMGSDESAVPGLLYKYFVDMRAAFRAVSSVLKPGAPFALVVGHNRTTLGGRRFEIVTPDMLAHIARAESFNVVEITPLQT